MIDKFRLSPTVTVMIVSTLKHSGTPFGITRPFWDYGQHNSLTVMRCFADDTHRISNLSVTVTSEGTTSSLLSIDIIDNDSGHGWFDLAVEASAEVMYNYTKLRKVKNRLMRDNKRKLNK